jgi:mRNA-degrading endonuclease YafQ of YafQ-DinJ toxin-antitoxin module
MYRLIITPEYGKMEKRFFKKHPDPKERYMKVLTLLMRDPHYPSLRLNRLKGNLAEYYSVSITMRYRIVIELVIREKEIILLKIGDNGEVY